jgi:DNA-directed RNA polymerase specialized sigma24 family protein
VIPNALPVADLVAALPRLRRYARVLTGDVNCADDLAQYTLARCVGEAPIVASRQRPAGMAVHHLA